MEPMVPWLLLVIAGLIVACAVMHSRLRETESATRGQQSVITDELRDAEAALVSALDRLRRMDQALSARESGLSQRLWEPQSAPSPSLVPPTRELTEGPDATAGMPARRSIEQPTASRESESSAQDSRVAGGGLFSTAAGGRSSVGRSNRTQTSVPWRARAIELAQHGLSPLEIAQELELPTGEVELVLALENH
jgi:hypothetical protein